MSPNGWTPTTVWINTICTAVGSLVGLVALIILIIEVLH
jgi:hypothetical protein